MRTYAEGRRRPWLPIAAGIGAMVAVGLTAACGPASEQVMPSATPSTAAQEPGGPDPAQVVPATTAAPSPGPGPTVAPLPSYQIVVTPSYQIAVTPSFQIAVKVEIPSATHRCNPAGSIEVYGTGFPVTITHEWRYRSATNPTGNGALLGPEVTHGFNVAGGKAISSQKLAMGSWEVQLRVTSPKPIATEWVTHNCAAILGSG